MKKLMINKTINKNMNNKIESFNKVIDYLEYKITQKLRRIPHKYKINVEEIRLRVDKPLMIVMKGEDYYIDNNGNIANRNNSYIVTKQDIIKSFEIICNYSIYAVEDELKNGFITIKGGHRIGVTGKVIYERNEIKTLKEISSLNIRIAKEIIGVSDKVIPYIIKKNNSIYHTLIVSPPGCGKTTLLRDIVRNLSDGMKKYNFKGLKVGVVDERSEIAGTYRGIPQNNIGVRTDVLDSCKKYDGIMLLIRSMSPHIVATDELGDSKDIKAIHEALKAGVKIISTVHGENMEDLLNKPNLKQIINENIFERFVIMDNSNDVGTIRDILEGENFSSILKKKENKNVYY